MTEITAVENVTVDGVMQAPGSRDEDPRGGFAHGGWAMPYMDEVAMTRAAAGMAGAGAMLLGRRTFELLRRSWSGRDDNPFSIHLDATRKYVVSTTLENPPAWANSIRLAGDPIAGVAALKRDGVEQALTIIGSGVLLRSLLAAELIDVLQLSIHPLALGSGTRLFEVGATPLRLTTTAAVTTTTGVVIVTYRRDAG